MEEESIHSSKLDSDTLERFRCLGENASHPKGYRLFVQTTGSGTRHLPGGSLLLYDTKNVHIKFSLNIDTAKYYDFICYYRRF